MRAIFKHLQKQTQKAQIIVLTALLMPLFIAITGLVTDIGKLYIVKSQLQNAMDAAALQLGYKCNDNTLAWIQSDIDAEFDEAIKVNFHGIVEHRDIKMIEATATNVDKYLLVSASTPVEPIFWKFFFSGTVDVYADAKVVIPMNNSETTDQGGYELNIDGVLYTSKAYINNKTIEGKKQDAHYWKTTAYPAILDTDPNKSIRKTISSGEFYLSSGNAYSYLYTGTGKIIIDKKYKQNLDKEGPIYIVYDGSKQLNIIVETEMDPKYPVILLHYRNGNHQDVEMTINKNADFSGIIAAPMSKLTVTNNNEANTGTNFHGVLMGNGMQLTSFGRTDNWVDTKFEYPEIVGATKIEVPGITTPSSGGIKLISTTN